MKKNKNMNIEEMASELEKIANYFCDHSDCEECLFKYIDTPLCTASGFIKWLKQEVEKLWQEL